MFLVMGITGKVGGATSKLLTTVSSYRACQLARSFVAPDVKARCRSAHDGGARYHELRLQRSLWEAQSQQDGYF
jgi:hypothetical protein